MPNDTALLIVQAKHGGYIVKEHAPYDNRHAVLFAGDLTACLSFIAKKWEATDE